MNKIRGKERRKLKKELNKIKSFVENCGWYYAMQKDMVKLLGGQLISERDIKYQINKANKRIKEIEAKLKQKKVEIKRRKNGKI